MEADCLAHPPRVPMAFSQKKQAIAPLVALTVTIGCIARPGDLEAVATLWLETAFVVK